MNNLKIITSTAVPQDRFALFTQAEDGKVSGVTVDKDGKIKTATWYEEVTIRVAHPIYFHPVPPGQWRAVKRGNGWSYERIEEEGKERDPHR